MVDKVANMVADIEVDHAADIVVNEVPNMKVDKVANLKVDKVANMKVDYTPPESAKRVKSSAQNLDKMVV